MPDVSSSPTAVFLSYAREDGDSARRIAEALRGFGVEVWFDQSELRGGDTWDAKIKTEIRTCTLFLAVISAQTQTRREGYFRREWKLAVERTHDMAEGVPFVVPVVVDDTAESRAVVPAEFMKVQWTRLPGGLPTPQFIEQVKRLLAPAAAVSEGEAGSPAGSVTLAKEARSAPRDGGVASPGKVGRALRARPVWIIGLAAAAVVLGVFGWRQLQPKAEAESAMDAAARRSAPPTSEKSAPAKSTADKSIAVLPFTNMSEDKDSGFFADGVQEDILTNLALIRDLRVVSRTSVAQYRDTKKTMRDIGQELGVTYLLEGSVRRAGGTVRVTVQLIRAANDEHVWAQKFDRELKDIFALQSALSTEIARALQAAVSPQEQKLIARRPTENPAAYDLYLKARRIRDSASNTRAMVLNQIALLDAALVLDPGFALAWGDLTWCHGWMYSFRGNDPTPARLEKARHAIETATRLAADAPETTLNLGYFHYFLRDYDRATQEFEKLLQARPNDPVARFAVGLTRYNSGKLKEGLEALRTAAQQDPANGDYADRAANLAELARRYDEALALRRRLVQLNPSDPWEKHQLARLVFVQCGSTRELDAFFAGMPAEQLNSPRGIGARRGWALTQGKVAEALALDNDQPRRQETMDLGEAWVTDARGAIRMAAAMAAKGNQQGAAARLERTSEVVRAALQRKPGDQTAMGLLGMILALRGNKTEALTYVDRASSSSRAFVLAWTGDKEGALAVYAQMFQNADGGPNVHAMRHDLQYHPLHGDPRWEAILNDPKNNAPLF